VIRGLLRYGDDLVTFFTKRKGVGVTVPPLTEPDFFGAMSATLTPVLFVGVFLLVAMQRF